MTAPDLSAEERAVVERFEAADPVPESLRWRVAEAIHEAVCICRDAPTGLTFRSRDAFLAADAAIAVMRGQR